MEENAEMYRCHISNYSFLQPSHISEMSSPPQMQPPEQASEKVEQRKCSVKSEHKQSKLFENRARHDFCHFEQIIHGLTFHRLRQYCTLSSSDDFL